jgi:hypothetical protein
LDRNSSDSLLADSTAEFAEDNVAGVGRVAPLEISLCELRAQVGDALPRHHDDDLQLNISSIKSAVKAKMAASKAAAAAAAAAAAESTAADAATGKRHRVVANSGAERLISHAFNMLGAPTGGQGQGRAVRNSASLAAMALIVDSGPVADLRLSISSCEGAGDAAPSAGAVKDIRGIVTESASVVDGGKEGRAVRTGRARSLLSSALKGIGGR